MLAVYRIYSHAVFFRFGHNDMSPGNKSLLVGKSHVYAVFYSRKSRKQADHSHHGIYKQIGSLVRSDFAQSLHSAQYLYARIRKPFPHFKVVTVAVNTYLFHRKLPCLTFQQSRAAVRR